MLSLVFPLFQDALVLPHAHQGVKALRAALPYPVEVVAVDDGSTDDTADQAERLGWHVIRQAHRGRGAAVRTGMLAAGGVYRMLVDPHWSIPPEQVQLLLPPTLTGFDLAVASRTLPGATRRGEGAARRMLSTSLARLVKGLVLPGISDVHAGVMCLRAEAARALFSRTREDGGAVAVEVLALARAFGLEVREVPVDWQAPERGNGHMLRDAPDLFAGMARVRARLATGAYPPLQAGAEPEAEERVEGMV
ncbi:MAG: glycosyltransferase [Alphaproteobacteria bacterium]|nr:glycosyltransferase [Alphaproteobacteria bacterium]